MNVLGSQASWKVLVANLSAASFPEKGIAADKIRTGFRMSVLQTLGVGPTQGGSVVPNGAFLGIIDGYAAGAPTRPSATITVVDNTFAGDSARLYVGPFTLVSGIHFTPGGGVNATATAIAAAVSLLPGYTGGAVGAVVTVPGPAAALGDALRLNADYTGGNKNFTFVWPLLSGYLGYVSNNPIHPPEVLP